MAIGPKETLRLFVQGFKGDLHSSPADDSLEGDSPSYDKTVGYSAVAPD